MRLVAIKRHPQRQGFWLGEFVILDGTVDAEEQMGG